MEVFIDGSDVKVIVDPDIYSIDILYKCLYWYGDLFSTSILKVNDSRIEVTLTPLSESVLDNFEGLRNKIARDLIDFKLRDIVTKETKNIRELIIAKAFSYYGLSENPETDVSDPVGFNPSQI